MGVCIYCGKKAGLFSHVHKECEQKHAEGQTNIIEELEKSIVSGSDLDTLDSVIHDQASKSFIDKDSLTQLIIKALNGSIEKLTSEGVISTDAEERTNNFMKHFSLNQSDEGWDKGINVGYLKMEKSVILREVMQQSLNCN